MRPDYDLCVIGGGINGAGIARDAAGRGLSVILVEAQDLAQATSSASTKLIHGGLRYLEQGAFGLVRHSLIERDALMRIAPHMVTPLTFVMPHVAGVRPKWMISLGLWLYDRLAGKKKTLRNSEAVNLASALVGQSLKPEYKDAFQYADCWTNDARLVVLNAMDARLRGAEIMTRTACVHLSAVKEHQVWHIKLKDMASGEGFEISAKKVVNAAGPWVRTVLDGSGIASAQTPNIRLIKGSHIIVPRLYDGGHAYLFQQPDKRIVFAIPYEGKFTLIGTTDVPFSGDSLSAVISEQEIEYLCTAVNRFFKQQIKAQDVFSSYSGVRALFDDGSGAAQKVTRDYKLITEKINGCEILSVFGGKLTTYRVLALQALEKLFPSAGNENWTAKVPLPGGDIPEGDVDGFLQTLLSDYPFMDRAVLERYVRYYGTNARKLLHGVNSIKDMGRDFGEGLYDREIFYLIKYEWAKTADDILWRRTKLGLHLEKKIRLTLEALMPDYLKKEELEKKI